MAIVEPNHVPRCTYRVQLHHEFDFATVGKLAAYFEALGVSDIYLSPIFTATPGSLHGYDVCDYRSVSPELGGSSGFEQLSATLKRHGIAMLADFVPNHMGIAGPRNTWWRDVLERGRQSPYADFFDIKWKPERAGQRPRVLVPILEDHYGKLLEAGKLSVSYDEEFAIRYSAVALPMSPASTVTILLPLAETSGLPEPDRKTLVDLIGQFSSELNPRADAGAKQAHAERIAAAKQRLHELIAQQPVLQRALAADLKTLNGKPGDAGSFNALHALLDEQFYRLARWKTGTHEINYRRFFAIDSLVGLHMERTEVFTASHALLGELIAQGHIAGLRIDHIDGLRDPERYLQALQRVAPSSTREPFYVVVEKILAEGENLPATWPVQGTSGYEFVPRLADLFVDASSEKRFDDIYASFTGDTQAYADQVYEKKRLIISEMFANAVSDLGAELTQIIADDWRWQDLTRHELTTAVSEIMASLDVYRTYRRDRTRVSSQDQAVLSDACAHAIAHNRLADPQPFEFLRDLLIGTYPPDNAPEEYQQRLLEWVLSFQQYSGAIMAKSVEDTAYYTYCRLIALNEVGGQPARFGGGVEGFHRANLARLAEAPHGLLTTSTHDTKLSEDARARLYTLSEIPGEWEQWVADWHRLNARHLASVVGGNAPDTLDEYRLYQILLAAWPLDEAEVNDTFRARLRQHVRKAIEEAKRHTSILHPNEDYLRACEQFCDAVTSDTGEFGASFRRAAHRVAQLGMVNSLAQVVLKCTVPGVPDIYQGNELWDFSLVDPDNRRPVDYARREALLAALDQRTPADLLTHWRDGALKLHATRTLLRYRAAHAKLFSHGTYAPVTLQGAFADRVVAFVREHEGTALLILVPRLSASLGAPPLGLVWDDTRVTLGGTARGWRDLFSQREFPSTNELPLREAFGSLPFAALEAI